MATEKKTLQSAVTIGRTPVTGHVDAESLDDVEILGYEMFSTTGELVVPREWLVEQFRINGLPEFLLPNPKRPSSAYRLAMQYLLEDEWSEREVNVPGVSGPVSVRFHMEDGNDYIRHVYVNMVYDEDQIGKKGGYVDKIDLGHFNYDRDEQAIRWHTVIPEDKEFHFKLWRQLIGRAQGLFGQMKVSHTGKDLCRVLLDLVKSRSSAIPLREGGAVYFFPAGYGNYLDGLANIWEELNQFKTDGRKCRIRTLALIDNENHRQVVRECAEQEVQNRIDDIVEAGIESLKTSEKKTVEDIAEKIIDDLGSVGKLSDDYGQILETRLSIKRNLEAWADRLEGEQREAIEQVVEQKGLDDFSDI